MTGTVPPPPPGFQIVPQQAATVPPPPPGFQLMPPAGAPQEDPEQTMVDTIMDGAGELLRRLGYLSQEGARGVTNLVGAPVDLINASPMLLNILPGEQGMRPFSENPIGGSQSLWSALTAPRDVAAEALGGEAGDAQPQDAFDRITGRVANEIGAAALPLAGAISAGSRLGVQGTRAMQTSARPIERVTGRFLESAAVNPTRFGATELGYATAAGTGAGIAREVAPEEWQSEADIVGALLGAGGMAVGQGVGRAATDVFSAATGRGGSQVVADEVAGQLGRAAGAPVTPSGAIDTSGLAQTLRTGSQITDLVPGYRPTSADVSQNSGLAALEYSRGTGGPNTGLFSQRRNENRAAAVDAVEGLRPDATPGAFSAAARTERDNQILEAQTRTYLAETQFDDAVENLRAVQSGEARGQTIRAALEDARESAREVERAAWSAVSGEVDPAPLAEAFRGIEGGLTTTGQRMVADLRAAIDTPSNLTPDQAAGPVPSSILDEFGRPIMREPTPISEMTDLAEITDLRGDFTDAIRVARASNQPNRVRVFQQFVDAIDGFLDGQGIGDLLGEARAVSFDLNERFSRRGTPIADALATRPTGGPALPDSQVAPRFVQPDERQASNIDRLLTETQAAGSANDVREALRDQILSDVNQRGLLERPDRLDEYLGQYEAVFNRFPELRDELGTAAGLRRSADDAGRAQSDLTRQLGGVEGQPGASAVARYLSFGDERAADAMASVTGARDPARAADELMEFVGNDPQAVEGARAAFWQLMDNRTRSSGGTTRLPGGEQPVRFASLDNFLSDPANRAVAERLYRDNPEHLENLTGISESLRGVDFGATGRIPNSSGTPQGLRGSEVLPSTETLGAYGFAYQRGQIGLPFIGLRLASTIARRATLRGRERQFQELLDEALLNPDLAARLAADNNPANIAALSRAAKIHLGVRAAWLDDLAGEEEDPALEDVIMED